LVDVINPATEQVVATVPLTSAEQTDAAIDRAHAALPAWRALAPGDRARLLRLVR
jgi:acyl-CoA reductase-like NAD-dependent aldehyde dehydrogenase